MRRSSSSTPALLAAALTCLVPLFALAAQQPPPAPGPGAGRPGGPGAGRANRPEPDARTSEIGLGLTAPENPNLPTIFLVGDSTVRNGHGTGSDGLWGWGAPIADLFDPSKVNVVNRAIGGLASHSFISAGHWENTLAMVKPGDFVLIQFGHNDGPINVPGAKPIPDAGAAASPTPPPARPLAAATPGAPPAPGAAPRAPMINTGGSLPGTGEETYDATGRDGKTDTIHTFGWYMRKYAADVKAKGATPVLCSLIPRKIWKDGKTVRQTSTFRGWTQQVAEKEHVDFVDLNEIIARQYDTLGEATVETLFGDPHTHTDMAGAVLNAECVVAGLRALPGDPISKYLSDRGRAIQAYKA
jgi:lysophospholipase L1-like esterase